MDEATAIEPLTAHRPAVTSTDRPGDQEGVMEPFSYTNKHGVTHYLHQIVGRDGRTYTVMRITADGAAPSLPEGMEVRENVHGQVSVRRIRTPEFSRLESQLLHAAVENLRPFAYLLDIEGKAATIYASAEDRKCFLESLDAEFADGFAGALTSALAQRYGPELIEMFRARRNDQASRRPRFYPLLRFVLLDRRTRRFAVERVCFSGESSWIRLESLSLTEAVAKYLPHLGRDSFFDLI